MVHGAGYPIGYDKIADDCCGTKDESKAIKGPWPILLEDASKDSSDDSASRGNGAKGSKYQILPQARRISRA